MGHFPVLGKAQDVGKGPRGTVVVNVSRSGLSALSKTVSMLKCGTSAIRGHARFEAHVFSFVLCMRGFPCGEGSTRSGDGTWECCGGEHELLRSPGPGIVFDNFNAECKV